MKLKARGQEDQEDPNRRTQVLKGKEGMSRCGTRILRVIHGRDARATSEAPVCISQARRGIQPECAAGR